MEQFITYAVLDVHKNSMEIALADSGQIKRGFASLKTPLPLMLTFIFSKIFQDKKLSLDGILRRFSTANVLLPRSYTAQTYVFSMGCRM